MRASIYTIKQTQTSILRVKYQKSMSVICHALGQGPGEFCEGQRVGLRVARALARQALVLREPTQERPKTERWLHGQQETNDCESSENNGCYRCRNKNNAKCLR